MRNIKTNLTSTMQPTTVKFDEDSKRMIFDRFGMFIHFGVYSHLAGWRNGEKFTYGNAEWIMRHSQIPLAEYTRYAYEFEPEPDWAKKLAKEAKKAGMKYAVLTTKHHDGYCLFKTDYSFYNHFSMHGRDLVREYVDAMREVGIKPGFYYSHAMDWAERDGAGYFCRYYGGVPANNSNFWDYPDRETKDFKNYFYGKCMPQVKELLTNYGDVYLIWFDYPHDITIEQSKELYEHVKALQPHCLVNSRIGHGYGDYNSLGDNTVCTVPLGVPNECLVTLNDTWGYRSYDENWKTDEEILEKLVRCTASQSSFLLNVGPKGDGIVPEQTSVILDGVGKWVEKYRCVLEDSDKTPFLCGFEWGSTSLSSDKKRLYLYVTDKNTDKITLNGINAKIKSVKEVFGNEQEYTYIDNALTINLNRIDKDQTIPVFVIEFENSATFSEISIQHGDLLTLTAYYGKKFRIDGDVHENVEFVFQYNLYDPLWNKRGMSMHFNATVCAWERENEYLEWTAEFTEDGEYECELVTEPMRGVGTVRVEVEGYSLAKELRADNPDATYELSRTKAGNSRSIYKLGRVVLKKGEKSIFIKRDGDGANIPFAELKFRKVK
ncbi:MAG: alpha-L-fucosidase [Clostridia bacterium]|nr:alpha-L-fucosidase [Clostridia bacterium]